MNPNTPNTPLLSYKKAEELAGALSRLHELAETKITTKESNAEAAGLKRFVADEAPKHLNEFLGCWFIIRREYEPLLNTLAIMAKRVQAIVSVKLPPPEEVK